MADMGGRIPTPSINASLDKSGRCIVTDEDGPEVLTKAGIREIKRQIDTTIPLISPDDLAAATSQLSPNEAAFVSAVAKDSNSIRNNYMNLPNDPKKACVQLKRIFKNPTSPKP